MDHPSPSLAALARRIVEHEAGASDPSASAAAVEVACGRLENQLVDVLGSGGVSALLGRALHLAKRENPFLVGVALCGDSGVCFTGLAESLAARTAEEATAAAATVLTHVLELLVTLFGEELGMKPVQKLWPQQTSVMETDE